MFCSHNYSRVICSCNFIFPLLQNNNDEIRKCILFINRRYVKNTFCQRTSLNPSNSSCGPRTEAKNNRPSYASRNALRLHPSAILCVRDSPIFRRSHAKLLILHVDRVEINVSDLARKSARPRVHADASCRIRRIYTRSRMPDVATGELCAKRTYAPTILLARRRH